MREPYSANALPVISDIHGNWAGFEAIVACLQSLNIMRPPLLLGDLVWTHFADRAASDLLRLLDTIMEMPLTGAVCGNTDAFFVNGWLELWNPADEHEQETRLHMLAFKSLLNSRHLAFFEGLPERHAFSMAGRECLACHASPLDNAAGLPLDAPRAEIRRRLAGYQMDCLLTGHLHTPFIRLMADGPLHISVGAAGRHPHEYDGIVDFTILDSTPGGLVAVHHRLLQPAAKAAEFHEIQPRF
jgi:predicted phosphodiesterase